MPRASGLGIIISWTPSHSTECNCSTKGSVNEECTELTGQCSCKTQQIIGQTCDECADGFFGFPNCTGKCFSSRRSKNRV